MKTLMNTLHNLKTSHVVVFIIFLDLINLYHFYETINLGILSCAVVNAICWFFAELKGERLSEELNDALTKLADLEEQSNEIN